MSIIKIIFPSWSNLSRRSSRATTKAANGGWRGAFQTIKSRNFFLHRCNIHLHLHCCQAKAVRCEIHGCKGIYRRGDREEHLTEAGRSHQVMQGAEIQRLRRLIAEKVKIAGQTKDRRWRIKTSLHNNHTSTFITLLVLLCMLSENGPRDVRKGGSTHILLQVGYPSIQGCDWAPQDTRQRYFFNKRSPVEGHHIKCPRNFCRARFCGECCDYRNQVIKSFEIESWLLRKNINQLRP